MPAAYGNPGAAPPPSPGPAGLRNARYLYLAGRLQNREITMEEATELFSILQRMLQASEAARLALFRASPTARAPPVPPPPPPTTAASGVPGVTGDDLLLVGLLALGAGAGVLAAVTKRSQEGTRPNGPPPG